MNLLPKNELYRYEILTTLVTWLIYSLVYYYTGNIQIAAFAAVAALAFTAAFTAALAFTAAFAVAAVTAAFAFAAVAALAFTAAFTAALAFTAAFAALAFTAAFTAAFAFAAVAEKIKMSRTKAITSIIVEMVVIWGLLYISNHLHIQITVAWLP